MTALLYYDSADPPSELFGLLEISPPSQWTLHCKWPTLWKFMMVCKRKLNINAYKCVCLYNNYYSFLFSPRYPIYPSFNPDTEGILSVMHDLKQKNLSDNTLLSNLDFAERFLRDHPLKSYSKLLVKGNYSCVQIGHNKRRIFIVTSEND